MSAGEFNFDGLIGPTHNYAGLSFGNVASESHQNKVSNPRAAALQGLEKMKFVAGLGIGQCVLPPLRRPRLELLRELGFTGNDQQLIGRAYKQSPALLASCFSASNMWTANAATVSPSADCQDGRLHLTPANLSSTLHRSIEPGSTTRNLRSIFADPDQFQVHDPLPAQSFLSDEGAANHTRLAPAHGHAGIEMFTFGVDPINRSSLRPQKFPARQTRLASESIARNHGLDFQQTVFLQQNPAAIDAGVFHNDVICVGNQNVLLCHEMAFIDQAKQLEQLKSQFERQFGCSLYVFEISQKQLSLAGAVASYLFNSQLVTIGNGKMKLICPLECRDNPEAKRCLDELVDQAGPIESVEFFNLRQSMNNGGGPACLRLRVVLTPRQQAALHQGVVWSEQLHQELVAWVESNYREKLAPDDLRDPNLITESLDAMKGLAKILDLPESVLLDV